MKTRLVNNRRHYPQSSNFRKNANKPDGEEGYPEYPRNEDIYSQFKKENEIDPEDISKKKEMEEIESEGEVPVTDLDVPGAELDDDLENIGSEDEENNYYSLGGENHEDLEEDKGD